MNDTHEDIEKQKAEEHNCLPIDKHHMPELTSHISTQAPTLQIILEGALMASNKPLTLDHLILLFAETERPNIADIQAALIVISESCEHRGFELKQVASGYRFQTKQSVARWVSRLWEEKPKRYTRALLETLALIAYRQPITRGEIEEVRGVSVSSNIIRTLQEREWVRIVGYRDVPGRPAMFATTRHFLDYFNLQNLNELPPLSEIRNLEAAAKALETQTDMLENITVKPKTETETEEKNNNQVLATETLFAELDEMEAELPENFNNIIKKQTVETLHWDEPANEVDTKHPEKPPLNTQEQQKDE